VNFVDSRFLLAVASLTWGDSDGPWALMKTKEEEEERKQEERKRRGSDYGEDTGILAVLP